MGRGKAAARGDGWQPRVEARAASGRGGHGAEGVGGVHARACGDATRIHPATASSGRRGWPPAVGFQEAVRVCLASDPPPCRQAEAAGCGEWPRRRW